MKETNNITSMLDELFVNHVFEIRRREGAGDIYDVPYMMNDALECYLVFTGAVMQGEFRAEMEEATSGSLVNREGSQGLIIRQGIENTCTLWFSEVHRELNCYQFHTIGHFWEEGAEQWRRLVYMIGTMQDKYLFLGEEVCNEEELALIPLMDFTPFCRYYPAKVCIPEEYVMTEEGCRCMLELAKEAGDSTYASVIRLYLRFPCAFLERRLHRLLMDVERGPLYDLICQRAVQASGRYPQRDYGVENNRRMQECRAELERTLSEQGYRGSYPDFQKGTIQIQAAEEHPFVRMEEFEKGFRIQLMVSEQPEKVVGVNRGFFRGRGLRGRICTVDKINKLLIGQ
ncbi:MAG: DUF3878 family protein [Clostridiales bacterium]|nr:DUF3878 family protein [Clostridiales bacterium]